ncbi:hypothetical protein EK21DRAFT_67929, partial [Setomelanomma holmii]
FCGCVVVALTLLLNLSATVYVHLSSVQETGSKQPLHPRLFLGSCTTALKLNTYVHFLINVLSTLILSSSNLFMQHLLSPTRAEVDKVHKQQLWVAIGIYNWGNLRFISCRNRVLWTVLAFSSLPLHLLYILEMEFGAADQNAFLQLGLSIVQESRSMQDLKRKSSMMRGFLAIVLFANTWQLLISLQYICTNALLTCFYVESEWQGYGTKRKSLRVSSPLGKQRSTYFLSLPWRYALPLTATFTILHWTLSQSMFLTVIAVNNSGGLASELLFLGTSPKPLMLTVAIGGLLLLVFAGICLRICKGVLPQGGSCSAIISAACHRPEEDRDAALKPVQWGEVHAVELKALISTAHAARQLDEHKIPATADYAVEDTGFQRPGHCCFTSYNVTHPNEGRQYC